MMKLLLYIALFLMLTQAGLAQVSFNQFPKDRQLFGRDLTTNMGTIVIEGTVDFAGASFDRIQVDLYRDGIWVGMFEDVLNTSQSVSTFSISIDIPAELNNYRVDVSGVNNGVPTFLEDADELVAGDVYIILGQSNAEALVRSDSCNYLENNFIRVYASGVPVESSLLANDTWYYGQGDGNRFSNGNTGQWGLKLARQIIDEQGIPVAIFNGAHGGKEIAFFQRPMDYATSIASNYGRLYYRLNKCNLKEHVRAVLWSQGEKDGLVGTGTTLQEYKDYFTALRSAWYEDYPSIEMIYLFQTKNGCNAAMQNIMGIKEAQRQMAVEFNNVQIMATGALPNFNDNCHFSFIGGYEEFGKRIYQLVRRDLYNGIGAPGIDAPMIQAAELVTSNLIRVQTNSLILTQNASVAEFELNNANGAVILQTICSSGPSFDLLLDKSPGHEATLSYLGSPAGVTTNYIVNSQGIELLSFKDFPVTGINYAELEETQTHLFSVVPNPGSDLFTITGKADVQSIQIMDVAGKILLQTAEDTFSGEILPNGWYFARVEYSGGFDILKLQVSH